MAKRNEFGAGEASPHAVENSFADLLAAIASAPDLKDTKKRHWTSSVRSIVKWLDVPASSLVARWTSVHFRVEDINHQAVGCELKTLQNHRANLRAALNWFRGEGLSLPRGVELLPTWKALRDALPTKGYKRERLSALMRYCSGKGIEPDAVTEAVIDDFMTFRKETTRMATDDGARRRMAHAWNWGVDNVASWPKTRLVEPAPRSAMKGPEWEEFPQGLRDDIDTYLLTFTKTRNTANGKRQPPSKASTIKTRQEELHAVARKAVQVGIPIEDLSSLAAMLRPDRVERIIDGYWPEGQKKPNQFVIELGWKFLSIAREMNCLGAVELAKLDEFRKELDDHRSHELTNKNRELIRKVRSGEVWQRMVRLPQLLLEKADKTWGHAEHKAALMAQAAVAIAILTVAPIRLGNLTAIRLNENLKRLDGTKSNYFLHFPDFDVKNRIQLEFELSTHVCEIIDIYLTRYRDHFIAPGSTDDALFPGEVDGTKSKKVLAKQVCAHIKRETGLSMTMHQFRHAAAAIYLQEEPGDYETVRQLLGHKNTVTTQRFYTGLETQAASRSFSNLIVQKLASHDED